MAATDLVPCYYTGQNYRWEKPAKVLPRSEVRRLKECKLGQFIENGKIFLFFKAIAKEIQRIWDSPASAKTILMFIKTHQDGAKLHYEMPMAGDRSAFARSRRHVISVSSRSLFNAQILPVYATA
jgi:hypothetical protein